MNMELLCESKCRACQIINGEYRYGKVDMPIVENEQYLAITSIGAFLEGWILIFTKQHTFSMKNSYVDNKFVDCANKIILKLKKVYKKKCIVFEHGANREGSIVACGTNHAHLHILPYNNSLLDEMKKDYYWIECYASDIRDIVEENEYWFYAENVECVENMKGHLHIIKEPESQYFRKILAKIEGENCEYNYKKHLYIENAERTYELLRE